MESFNKKKFDVVVIVFMVVLIVLILPVLLLMLTLVLKSAVNPDYPPDIFGYAPLTVASGSMTGNNEDSFNKGDLIFIKVLSDDEKNEIEEQDVICFTEDGAFVTHRVISTTYEDGTLVSVITRGDANSIEDSAVLAEDIYGIYVGKIPNLGDFAEFLQTPAGIVVFAGLPIAAFVLFEAARFVLVNKKKVEDGAIEDKENEIKSKDSEIQSKDEEIARLKKMLGEQGLGDAADKPEDDNPEEQPEEKAEESAKEDAEGVKTAAAEPAEEKAEGGDAAAEDKSAEDKAEKDKTTDN